MTSNPLIAALPHIPPEELAGLRPIQIHRLLTAVQRGWSIDWLGGIWRLSKPAIRREIRLTAAGLSGLRPPDIS